MKPGKPICSHRDDIPTYITKDGSEIRECLHPDHHGPGRISMAEARVLPGKETMLHVHHVAEEVYRFLSGEGWMRLGERSFSVRAGDVVRIPPGYPHAVQNTGAETLFFLCCCTPAYSHEDTRLLEENPFADPVL